MRRILTAREQVEMLSPWEPRTSKVQLHYLRNNNGMRNHWGPDDFEQRTEPWGRYMAPEDTDLHPALQKGWERGVVDFENPLYVPHNYGAWKQELSEAHGGLTGRELSQALLDKGHDGVITHDKYGLGEIVDIRPKDQRGHRVTSRRIEATPAESKPGDPTYMMPVGDLRRHRQFNPAIQTPQDMYEHGHQSHGFSSGGSSENSTEEQLVEGYERGDKFPPAEIITNGQHAILSDGTHRNYVADMMSQPEMETYIHYGPQIPDAWFERKFNRPFPDPGVSPVEPNSQLGKHISDMVQNHPYKPYDDDPNTRYVFRQHPETGQWQRGVAGGYRGPQAFEADFGDGPQTYHPRELFSRRWYK